MVHTILTHPGGAHKDDVLAVCVLIAEFDARVVRRDPTAEDLADPGVVVVDIGGEHDPARMNFDHHQFPREHAPTCALSLVLGHLGLYEDAVRFCDWLETAEWFDSRGPKRTAAWLGVPRKAISQLNSPVDITLLRRFAHCVELSPGEPLYEFMRFVGEDLVGYLRGIRERIDVVRERIERWSLPCGEETIEVVFLPRNDAVGGEDSSGSLSHFVIAEGLTDVVAAMVYPDRRGEGYGISRFDDHPRLDFSRMEDDPDVRFAHKSGFVCKTDTTDVGRIEAIIRGAWLEAPAEG